MEKEDFLRELKYTPIKSKSKELNDDYVKIAENKRQQNYRAQKGSLDKAKGKGTSKSKRAKQFIAAVTAVGALALGTFAVYKAIDNINQPPADSPKQIEIVQPEDDVAKEYEQLEDITETLKKAKQHYEMRYNANGESITEENMNEELKNIKELLKTSYKVQIGKACGVKPKDISEIRGTEDRVLNVDDNHINVYIPAEISPTGKAMVFSDEEVPENIAELIRIAGSINTNLNFEYSDSNIVWGKAVGAINVAIQDTEGKEYVLKKDGENYILEESDQIEIQIEDEER